MPELTGFEDKMEWKKNANAILQHLLLLAIGGIVSAVGYNVTSGLEAVRLQNGKILTSMEAHVAQPGHREYMIWKEFVETRLSKIETINERLSKSIEELNQTLIRLNPNR